LLGFGRRYVTDGLQESPVVEPVYPFQRRELDGFERAPSCSSMDELGLIEAIDRLGESVVVGIADAVRGLCSDGTSRNGALGKRT
jgi:hypothetical protein